LVLVVGGNHISGAKQIGLAQIGVRVVDLGHAGGWWIELGLGWCHSHINLVCWVGGSLITIFCGHRKFIFEKFHYNNNSNRYNFTRKTEFVLHQ